MSCRMYRCNHSLLGGNRANAIAYDTIPWDVSGIKLLPDEKHDLSEVPLNDYAYQLNLTIKRLDGDDFGSYTCSAENLLGKAEGTIRLQGDQYFIY